MEMTVGMFILLLMLAFICEFIDSSLGMGYGTILSPILLILGFGPLVVVPAILLSQAFGGFTASVFHHQFENVSFKSGSKDMNIVIVITAFGIAATILAAFVALNVPKWAVKTYIGLLVTIMGVLILRNRSFVFSWNKMIGLGILSAFNKGLSGGGFGPIVTAGQVLGGQDHKAAIGTTTLAEAPICICAFFTYMIGKAAVEIQGPILKMQFSDFVSTMFSSKIFQWEIYLALIIGSVLVAPFGAFTTRTLNKEKMHIILGPLVIILGCWTLYKTWF